jgi:membrane protein implicated in regulation of membrane protease activity
MLPPFLETHAMWVWFGLAALAVIGELGTGTFYLLLTSLALAMGGVAAGLGLGIELQLLAVVVTLLAVVPALRRTGFLKKHGLDPQRNADVNPDIGQQVNVGEWGPDGAAQISYRGSPWQARLAPGEPAGPGTYTIVEVRDNRLILSRQR